MSTEEATAIAAREGVRQRAALGATLQLRFRVSGTWPYPPSQEADLGLIQHGGALGVDHGGFVVLGALRVLTVTQGGASLDELARVLDYFPQAILGDLSSLAQHGWVEAIAEKGEQEPTG